MQAHVRDGPRLLRVDCEYAQKAATRQGLPSPDVGIFGRRFVVFFQPPPRNSRGAIRVKLCPITDDLRRRLRAYARELGLAAKALYFSPQGKVQDQDRPQDEVDKDLIQLEV